MSELREVFEMTTKQVEPDLEAWREQEKRQRRANRNKKIGAFAVVAALGVVAFVAILGPKATTPPKEPGVNPADATAEEVATSFVRAYGALDADQAITYLADDADISELMTSVGAQSVEGTLEEFRLLISLMEAQGYKQMFVSCDETGSFSFGTAVRCTFDFHLLGSDAFGHAPFDGSYFDVAVRGGEIVRASLYLEIERFSPEMWEPFADWVSTNYPEDAAVMYGDETYSGARLAEESIRLWRQRIGDYLNEVGSIEGAPFTGRISRIVDGVPFSFSVPTGGWQQFGTISLNKGIVGPQGAEAIIFWTSYPGGDGADPCANVLSPPVGPTAADLAAAVSRARGTELVVGPSEVTVGGHPAKHVVLTVREDVGCDPGYFYTWQDVQQGTLWPETRVGDTIRVWIVDVDGTLLFIEAETTDQADAELEREIQQIVGSISFD
jgi:hypothetical protein